MVLIASFIETLGHNFLITGIDNEENGITPQTIKKAVRDLISISKKVEKSAEEISKDIESMSEKELLLFVGKLTKKMNVAAAELNFELAAELRDQIVEIKKYMQDTF